MNEGSDVRERAEAFYSELAAEGAEHRVWLIWRLRPLFVMENPRNAISAELKQGDRLKLRSEIGCGKRGAWGLQ